MNPNPRDLFVFLSMTICTSLIRPNLPKSSIEILHLIVIIDGFHLQLPLRSCSVVRCDNPKTPKTELGTGFSR